MQVSFDGHQEVRIEVDTDLFHEKTEGLCGFLDNRLHTLVTTYKKSKLMSVVFLSFD